MNSFTSRRRALPMVAVVCAAAASSTLVCATASGATRTSSTAVIAPHHGPTPHHPGRHNPPQPTKPTPAPSTAFQTVHAVSGAVLGMASGAAGELFVNERASSGNVVERLSKGAWTRFTTPGNGVALSSAGAGEFWTTNITTNQVVHWKNGTATSYAMPQAVIDQATSMNAPGSPYKAGAPVIDGVADIAGDGALVGYRIPFSHGDVVDYYKVTDAGVQTADGSATEAGTISYKTADGRAYLSYTDRYATVQIDTFGADFVRSHKTVGGNLSGPYYDATATVAGGGQLWLLDAHLCNGTASATINPTTTCVAGHGVETASGVQVLTTDAGFQAVRQPGTSVALTAPMSAVSNLTNAPGTNTVWGSGTLANGSTVIMQLADASKALPA